MQSQEEGLKARRYLNPDFRDTGSSLKPNSKLPASQLGAGD